jgi:hypothetical protein
MYQRWLTASLSGGSGPVGGSVLFDHNGYLRNQDQLVSRLLNDLVAAAYGDSSDSPAGTGLVRDADLIRVGQRRHRLILGIVAVRILSVVLAAALWWVNPGRFLAGPMNRLVHLFAPHAGMGDGLARLIAAVLITAVAYVAAVIVWRIAEEYVVQRFFRTAERLGRARQQDPHEQMSQAVVKETSGAVS